MARRQESNLPDQSKITSALAKWDANKAVNQFVRERLGLKAEGTTKTHAEVIFDNAIERAKHEKKPEWTKMLAELTQDSKNSGNTTNVQINIGDFLDKLKD